MKPIWTKSTMRAAEQRLFDAGLPSIALMERAAEAVCATLTQMLGGASGKTVVFACGTGGNGGDGYAAARLFARRGGRSILLPTGIPRTSDARINAERAQKVAFGTVPFADFAALPRPDAWVDAVFGIGLSRDLSETLVPLWDRIECDRKEGAKVLAVDIPSGLDADTGHIWGHAIRADVTVTFQAAKPGHYIGEGMAQVGALVVQDIGIPMDDPIQFAERPALWKIMPSDLATVLPVRPRTAYKNRFGHLLLIAGSRGMAGAALLAAQAALRSGVGLLTVACPESLASIVPTALPPAMCLPLPEVHGVIGPSACEKLEEASRRASAIAIGPGLSQKVDASIIEWALTRSQPAVVDADALNGIAAHYMTNQLTERHVITPHPGEAARLLGHPVTDALAAARELHAFGRCTALLKGATSLIATSDRTYLSASGGVGMAKGGSGDALTGIIGAWLAQGVAPETAAWMGSEIHGLAGEYAERRYGAISMTPTELIDALPTIYMTYGQR